MQYSFKPKFIPTIAFLMLLPLLLWLGFWQLDRAEQKQAILDALTMAREQAPLTLEDVLINPEKVHYYGIEITGQFVPGYDVLLMHQMEGTQHGYHLLTPFEIAPDQPNILMNRGFIGKDNLANIPPPPTQPITIHGIIDLPKPDRFILGENILEPLQRPLQVQRVDIAEISSITGLDYYPIVVLTNRDAKIITTMPPEKHLGYALQWFGLALCLSIIYIVVNIKKVN